MRNVYTNIEFDNDLQLTLTMKTEDLTLKNL